MTKRPPTQRRQRVSPPLYHVATIKGHGTDYLYLHCPRCRVEIVALEREVRAKLTKAS